MGFPQYPSLSPEGETVVFVWSGDLWSVPLNGGISSRVTAHPAEERRPIFSPDGRWLAFESGREGARNLYVAPVDNLGISMVVGAAVRVTNSDQAQSLGGFTADGKGLVFASTREPAVYRSARMYKVELMFDQAGGVVGGGAVSRLTDAFGMMPRVAADGATLVFVRGYAGMERPKYRGSGNQDLARVNFGDGIFTALTSNMANDSDGWPMPDGSVVFISSRDGQNNVWRLAKGAADADAVQLTKFAPAPGEATIGHGVRDLAVSANGKRAVFVVWDTMYSLDLTSGSAKPKAIVAEAAGDSAALDFQRMNLEREISDQAISPDGKTLAVIARGEVFVRSTQEGHPTRRVTETAGRELDLAWSPDGRVLYFASDNTESGAYGLFMATVELAREDIAPPVPAKPITSPEEKKSTDEKVEAKPEGEQPDAKAEKPAESKTDKKSDKKVEKKPDHGKRWADSLRYKVEPLIATGSARALSVEDLYRPVPSPDGKKLLFTRGRGDLVLMTLADKSERVLLKSWDEPEAIWAGDSRHIIYAVSDLDYNSDIWLMDTSPASEAGDTSARRWTNPVNLTQHPDTDASPRLSADGKVLAFISERAGENGEFDVWTINLDRAIDAMTAYERDEYYKKAAEAAGKRKPLDAPVSAPGPKDEKADEKKADDKKPDDGKAEGEKEKEKDKTPPAPALPFEFDAEDAYLRVRRLTSTPGAESSLALTPGGDRVLFVASGETERSLVSIDFKGGDRKVLQAGAVGNVTLTLTGDKVAFIKTGQVFTTNPKTGGKVDALPIDAPITIDIARQQMQKFGEAARVIGTTFYHPTLKGLDWDALSARYLALAQRTRTNEEFNRVVTLLFGELDGSHLGIGGGAGSSGGPPVATGYLGVVTVPAPGGFRVMHIAMGTPADAKLSRLVVGDIITAIDGRKLAADEGAMPTVDLDAALAGRAGKETLVEVRRVEARKSAAPEVPPAAPAIPPVAPAEVVVASDAKPTRLLLMVPLGYSAWDEAQYWDEVGLRRKRVDELSGGKLGYLHIRAMGAAAVRDFERDLYAAAHGKQGLIIDVRDNGGGSTADILLAALTAPNHAYTQPRGVELKDIPRDAYPRDRRLIYSWNRPVNVLINQNSFSNAEIFAHAIKTTGRGKLIGTATFGGVISTGAKALIDGTTIRLPGRGWYLPDGRDMENNGAQPDVEVAQTPADEAAGRDRQLEAAVTELMGR